MVNITLLLINRGMYDIHVRDIPVWTGYNIVHDIFLKCLLLNFPTEIDIRYGIVWECDN
jgi:hypothetical protein